MVPGRGRHGPCACACRGALAADSELVDWAELAREATPAHADAAEAAGVDRLTRAAQLWMVLEVDPVGAAERARKLAVEAEQVGDDRSAAYAWCTAVWAETLDGGDLVEAVEIMARVRRVLDAVGDGHLAPLYHCASANVAAAMGDPAGRFDHFEQMRTSSARVQDSYHEVVAMHDMALVFDRPDLLTLALERAADPAVARRLTATAVISLHVRRARALCTADEADEAVRLARKALAVAAAAEPPPVPWRGEALLTLALAMATQGGPDAEREATAALEDAEALNTTLPTLGVMRARVLRALGRQEEAIEAYERVIVGAAEADVPLPRVMDAAQELAPLHAEREAWRRAYEVQVLFEHLRSRKFAAEDLRRLRGLEVQQQVALARQQADEERRRNEQLISDVVRLEELAVRDALTGLYNRRRSDAELRDRLRHEPATQAEPICVALLDVDHFKSVNDRYGHATGDIVLREVAQIVQRGVRADDVAARYGGEEFIVVLGVVGLDAGRRVVERIRLAVAAHPWGVVADGLVVTVSAGLAEATPGVTAEELTALADARLYEAKRTGRNRTVG
jgi:diguanylate cyclase (GGDEF)-like protein